MGTSREGILSALRDHIRASGEPVATTTDVADRVEVVRRTVLSKLELLEQRGDVASKDVGRGRVWWPVDDDRPADPPAERVDPPADPPAEPRDAVHERSLNGGEDPPADRPAEPSADPSAEPLADLDDVDDVLDELVDEGASDWDQRAENLKRGGRGAAWSPRWACRRWVTESRYPSTESCAVSPLIRDRSGSSRRALR